MSAKLQPAATTLDLVKNATAVPTSPSDVHSQVLEHSKDLSGLYMGIILMGLSLIAILTVMLCLMSRRIRRGKMPADLALPTGDVGHLHTGSKILLPGNCQATSDIPRILTFIPTDVYVDGGMEAVSPVALASDQGHELIRTSHTTFTGKLNPFSCQFSDFVASEGGEVLSPESEVSVTIPKNCIPVGRIQQMFVNVCYKVELVSADLEKVQGLPLVEVLTPGLRTLPIPVVIRIPLPPGGAESGVSVFWSHTLDPAKLDWLVIPREREDPSIKQLMCYKLEDGYISIRTHHVESFVCYTMVNQA